MTKQLNSTKVNTYYQFTSKAQNFRATLIAVHIIGCDFMFHVYNLNTNLKVGTMDGSNGTLRFQDADSSLSSRQLKELSDLCLTVEKECSVFQ